MTTPLFDLTGRVALVTGGLSGEAQISYKSAITVGNNVDRDKFEIYRIDINSTGWWYEPAEGEKSKVNREDFSVTDSGTKIHFDVILLCIHGTPGEDGKLQGYFDMLQLPYTSCDAATSALTFNKRYTVAVAAFGGIHVAKSLHLFKHTPVSPEDILQQVRLPVFVKPNNGGSSIGMSKVNAAGELNAARADAAAHHAPRSSASIRVNRRGASSDSPASAPVAPATTRRGRPVRPPEQRRTPPTGPQPKLGNST